MPIRREQICLARDVISTRVASAAAMKRSSLVYDNIHRLLTETDPLGEMTMDITVVAMQSQTHEIYLR